MRRAAGEAFNVGGGPERTLSLRELLGLAAGLQGEAPAVSHAGWRAAAQRWYVSDTRKIRRTLGWRPSLGVVASVLRLHAWLRDEEPGIARAVDHA